MCQFGLILSPDMLPHVAILGGLVFALLALVTPPQLGFGIGGFHHTDGAPVVHRCEKISPVIFSEDVGSLREL